MRSISSWRVSTWLIVLWSALWAFLGALPILARATTPCHGQYNSATPICEDAATLVFGIALYLVFLVWLVGLIVLIVIWAITSPDGGQGSPGKGTPHKVTPRGACVACGARVADIRETCPRCGHSPQGAADLWEPTSPPGGERPEA
jgi:hypothetical protein